MLNQTANPDNKKYHTEISGTANLRKALQAPILATKGHFYQIGEPAQDKVAIINDREGKWMKPNPEIDETTLGVEQLSGVAMLAK